ncbi:MAG: HNH endonuclease [bacterium]
MSELTAERLRELLDYCPRTGAFRWRKSRGGKIEGSVAGYSAKNGYLQLGVDKKLYLAHRLAWLYVYGEWPARDVDHANGDRRDNRAANLRLASRSQNMQNQRRAHKDSKSGYLGVGLHASGLWRASITIDRTHTHLGYFKTPEEAHEAYIAAKTQLHPFSPTNS